MSDQAPIEYYQDNDFHTKELEVSKESTKTDFTLGVPYSFYPYLHPITKIVERSDFMTRTITRSGVWRKLILSPPREPDHQPEKG